MPVVLKRGSVPTGEPDNTERVPSGSVGGWGKRSVSNLARSLPNLRSRFRQQVSASVRCLRRKVRGETASMPQNWRDLASLLDGTATQRAAYHALEALRVFALLGAFDPILAGTIPLDIDVPGSDLDVV